MNATGNFTVIVTRPSHQAAAFIDHLQKSGSKVVALPTIEIRFRETPLGSREKQQLIESSLWILTSANAAIGAARLGVFKQPHSAFIACIGQATAAKLKEHGITADLVPGQNTNSEGLLSQLEKYADLSTVVILQGGEGRDKLRTELSNSGRTVCPLNVYQRERPALPTSTIDQSVKSLPCTISITSNQGLLNLLSIIPGEYHEDLFQSSLIVNSRRCESLARELGFSGTIAVATPPGNKGQLLAIEKLQLSTKL